GERKRDRVNARPQIQDLVGALTIADDRPRFFNQRRTRRFDRHTRKNRPCRVPHHSGNRTRLTLRECRNRRERDQRNKSEPNEHSASQHIASCWTLFEVERRTRRPSRRLKTSAVCISRVDSNVNHLLAAVDTLLEDRFTQMDRKS